VINFSEAYGNLVSVVGNPQINSAFVICANCSVNIEHVKWDSAPLAVNADRQKACREHKPPGFQPFSIYQDKYGRGQHFGGS
jgi:hypothetical protein